MKIVNFGYSTVNASGSKGSSQPWHVMFDLSVNDHVSTSSPTDNFSMFYLDIFLKRLWPLLQQVSFDFIWFQGPTSLVLCRH